MKDDITKPTRIYGASDDLIEVEGGLNAEHGEFNTSIEDPCAVFLSDGTVLSVVYAPSDKAIWKIEVKERGNLFDRIEPCTDEDADPHSDVVWMRPGVRWAYANKYQGEEVRRIF